MIYTYRCHKCDVMHDVLQGMNDKHEYTCDCGEKCVRVYQKSQVKRNAGFYSWTLGEWVGSQTDFEDKLRRVRYVTGEGERLNDNNKPKDEWIESRLKKEQKKKVMLKEAQEHTDRLSYDAQKG